MRKKFTRTIAIGLLMAVAITIWMSRRSKTPELAYSEVLASVQKGEIDQIVVRPDGSAKAHKATHGAQTWVTFRTEPGADFYQALVNANVPAGDMPALKIEGPGFWQSTFFPNFLALLLAGGLLTGTAVIVIMESIDSLGLRLNKIMEGVNRNGDALSKNEAALNRIGDALIKAVEKPNPLDGWASSGWQWVEKPAVALADVGGLDDDVKQQVGELITMLKETSKFQRLGARAPRGILLAGPPGVGKTMLAHAIARESGYPMCCVFSASIIGPYTGMAAQRMKTMFEQARQKKRCVIFIDEAEILCARRSTRSNFDNEAQNSILLEFDRTENQGIVLIGATNRIDALEPALLRMGRFERQLFLDLPNESGRLEILRLHGKDKPFDGSVKFEEIASARTADEGTAGFSGADLAEVLNEAAVSAGITNQPRIQRSNMDAGLKRVRHLMRRQTMNGQDDSQRALFEFYERNGSTTSLASIGGMIDAKERLQVIIDFLRNPQTYVQAGCRVPRGILLSGPPGVGKTLLARAAAGEAGTSFLFTSGSAFSEKWVGIAAARVRDLFRVARRHSPCIIFIDEIDAIGAARSATDSDSGGGAREFNQTLNQLLTEMDGFHRDHAIVVMAATNRTDVLDPALLRPGRFDYVVPLQLPDDKDRLEILNIYLNKADELTAGERERLIGMTRNRSGADIENLVNTARIYAVRTRRAGTLRWTDLEYALTADHRNQNIPSPLS